MDKVELVSQIEAAMADVLETMFFTSVMEARESAGAPDAAGTVFSRLSFSGSPSGMFEIGIAQDAARSLAADFLGEDGPNAGDPGTHEVVCELANMLCGSVLSRIGGSAVFELSHPAIAYAPLEAPTARVDFELPEGNASAAVCIEECP